MIRSSVTRRACIAALGCMLFTAAQAQADYPRHPIKLMHGFTPGGNVDVTARLVAQHLGEALGQTVIVEGKPGAGGTVAAATVAKAAPDGYTLFLMASGHSMGPSLYRSLPYDSVNDFTMISLVTRFPFAIAVGGGSSITSLSQLMSMAKDKPGQVSMAHAGIGTGMHLAGAMLQNRTGARFNEIPYRGGSHTPTAAAQGEVDAVIESLATMDPFLQNKRLRLLAVTSRDRWPTQPEVPTISETVSKDFEVMGWTALAGPKNLPPPIVERLSSEMKKIMARPDIIETLRRAGVGATSTEPKDTQRLLATETTRWQQLIREEKIQLPN